MKRRFLSGFVPCSIAAGLFTVCCAIVTVAQASETAFDGVYTGSSKVAFGPAAACGSDSELSLTVKNGEFEYKYGVVASKYEINQDGSFSGKIRYGGRGNGGYYTMTGNISNGVLGAKFYTTQSGRLFCSYHWSLRKN